MNYGGAKKRVFWSSGYNNFLSAYPSKTLSNPSLGLIYKLYSVYIPVVGSHKNYQEVKKTIDTSKTSEATEPNQQGTGKVTNESSVIKSAFQHPVKVERSNIKRLFNSDKKKSGNQKGKGNSTAKKAKRDKLGYSLID